MDNHCWWDNRWYSLGDQWLMVTTAVNNGIAGAYKLKLWERFAMGV